MLLIYLQSPIAVDKDGNEKKGTDGYFKLLDALEDHLTDYVVTYDGEEYEVVKKDDVWYWKDREDLFIENISIDLISKTARKELRIEEAQTNDSLKKLGLKDPEYSLTLKDSKGRMMTFYVGKQISDNTYFVQNGSNKKVYTASEQIMGVIDSLMAMRSVSEQMEVVGQ